MVRRGLELLRFSFGSRGPWHPPFAQERRVKIDQPPTHTLTDQDAVKVGCSDPLGVRKNGTARESGDTPHRAASVFGFAGGCFIGHIRRLISAS